VQFHFISGLIFFSVNFKLNYMKQIFTSIISLFFIHLTFGQLVTPFTIRYQAQQKGGITFISNSAVTCNGGVGCTTGQSEMPPLGTGSDDTFTAAYIDIDSDTNTYMSSSDSLSIPLCSEISWAGLYWGGENQSGDPSYANRNQVKLKVNNGIYQTLTADYLEDNIAGASTYHCYKDVTSILQANGLNTRYTLADIAARVGSTNRFGGWTIVVVYKNDLMKLRNLTVFNGLSNVSLTNPITDIPVTGFLTPTSGPVNFELGMVVYDGDRNSTGDQLQLNGNGSFVNITDALNPVNDIFNSTISSNGILSPFRNPSYNNTLGFDADIFYPDNIAYAYIGNGDTSAIIRQTTTGDNFLTQVVTSAIDIYEPDLRASVKVLDINGGTVLPGDTLEYTVTGKNIGADASINTFIIDSLQPNILFVPGSIKVTWGPNPGVKTDALADDQGEYDPATKTIKLRIGSGANSTNGGTVLNSVAGTDSSRFVFRVTASTSCITLACDNLVDNQAIISGTGNVSGNTWSNSSTPGFGCLASGTTNSVINTTACIAPSDTTLSACNGAPFTIAYNLPGYTYYNNSFAIVTNTDATGTFYAINTTYTGCADTVLISITALINCDLDNDNVFNAFDIDDDNDGIPDSTEIFTASNGGDTDNDGSLDEMDLDSDNDGITDVIEAGGIDINGDGKTDGFVDANNNGLSDNIELSPLPGGNVDGDPFWNGVDLDSDDDGITDVREAGGIDPDNNGQIGTSTGVFIADTDNDGLADIVDPDNGGTPLARPNTDATGAADYLDLDSDGDGIVDNIEAQATATYLTPIPSGNDVDGDGMSDTYDNISGFGGAGITPVNTDGADNADYRDTNSDNDLQSDVIEGWDTDNDGIANTIPSGVDADSDGLDNAYDNNDVIPDPDNNQTPASFPNLDNTATAERDWREGGTGVDSDGDGIVDSIDLDDDNDGLPDTVELATASNGGDTDLDGTMDILDLDSDNDGIKDVIEAGGTDPDNDGVIGIGPITDTDSDGLSNIVDTDNGGIALPNPDTDGDGKPNFQDLDSDNDTVSDSIEKDPFNLGNGLADTDNDGILNYLDTNDDNDILPTTAEADENNDGILDDCDTDFIPDYLDPDDCGLYVPSGFSPNGDGINDQFVINGLWKYPGTKLSIFNRWGNLVFYEDNYTNNWTGGVNQGVATIGGETLPVGTYFYAIDFGTGKDPVSGYVYLNR
jgi:gliding motility-associated-like protein/uncharacterized repeat protein (TIGR01451 family)